MEGTPFGQYRLLGILGQGGMGEIYRAYDSETSRVVALKLLPEHSAADAGLRERFRHEARITASLREPHVIPIHRYGEINGRLFLDMPLIDGVDAHSMVAQRGPMPPQLAVSVIEQVADALDAAHAVGLVHRDVKPANMLLTARNFVYLIDFGIAREMAGPVMTSTGTAIGSFAYMAPERWTSGTADARSDVYSLACSLYECLTGASPFGGASMEQLIAAHLTADRPRPSAVGGRALAGFDAVVARGMAPDPAARYRSAGELAQAARSALEATGAHRGGGTTQRAPHENHGAETVQAEVYRRRLEKNQSKRRLVPAVGALLTVGVIAGGVVTWKLYDGDSSTALAGSRSALGDCVPEQASASGDASTDALRIGTLLPQTGNLDFLGPAQFAGVDLAVDEINAAGGVLGQPVTSIRGDSGDTSTTTASTTVSRLLSSGVQAIVGATSSAVSLKVLDQVADAGVLMVSPANTSETLTCQPDGGLYFRTAPSDVLQAQALAQLIVGDGVRRVSLLALDDPYATGLAQATQGFLVEAGVASDQIQVISYDSGAASFASEVNQVAAFDPDGIAVIGFTESAAVIEGLNDANLGPSDRLVYGVDGNMGNALGEGLPRGALAGMRGTTPLAQLSADFTARVEQVDPSLTDLNYAAEAYDAVVIIALAAEVAQSTRGADMALAVNNVTRDGVRCTSFAECLPHAREGRDFNYDGASGPLDFDPAGEPSVASYAVVRFDSDNTISSDVEYLLPRVS